MPVAAEYHTRDGSRPELPMSMTTFGGLDHEQIVFVSSNRASKPKPHEGARHARSGCL
jgi:hypothetical protein